MRTQNPFRFLAAAIAACLLLGGCAGFSAPAHEPLTIMTGYCNYAQLEKALKEEYPEIRLEFISYRGANTTEYGRRLLEAGQIPDIYTTKVLPEADLQKNRLIDLSGYEFSARYAASRLNECSVNGSLYLLPCNFSVLGIHYNKTLFEKHGWAVPTSFYELQQLVPQIRAAGVKVATTNLGYAGNGFQYLFALADTMFLRTPEGLDWEEAFLQGRADAAGAWADTVAYMQEWIDLGMLNGDCCGKTSREAREAFYRGDSAFYISGGAFHFSQSTDANGNEYGLMPWLSRDGSNNRYLTSTDCYFGLSADLELPRNKQKLADALKVMDFISTEKGQRILAGNAGQLLPLQESDASFTDEYRDVIKMLNAGFSAPLTYRGWEDVIVPVGEECREWCAGRSTGKKVIAVMERSLRDSLRNETGVCAVSPEDLTLEQTAELVGKAFMEAAGADCALISLGGYHNGRENEYGVNGRLFAGPINDVIISTFNPLGWVDTIKTFTLTGQEITALLQSGFDRHQDGDPFPYVLTLKDGSILKSDSRYRVVICGYSSETAEKGRMQDTKIRGMDAIRHYLSGLSQ